MDYLFPDNAELITILALLLYKKNIISLEMSILLILIFSLQRVICNRHTIKQVLVGIFLGLIYGNIYNSYKYSYIIIILFGLFIANLIVMKIDYKVNKEIPNWVSKEMYPYIKKKQNISHIYKISHIYYNCYYKHVIKEISKYEYGSSCYYRVSCWIYFIKSIKFFNS